MRYAIYQLGCAVIPSVCPLSETDLKIVFKSISNGINDKI